MQMLTVKTVLTRNQSNSHPRFACPPGSGALTTLPTLPLAQCTAGTSKFRVLAVALGMLILLGVSSPLCFSLLSQVQREPARLRERPGARGEGDHHRHVAGVADDRRLSSSHPASCRCDEHFCTSIPHARQLPNFSTAPPSPDLLPCHLQDMLFCPGGWCSCRYQSPGEVQRCHFCLVLTSAGW